MGAVGELIPWFELARQHGFLGNVPVQNHIEHATRFADAVATNGLAPSYFLDLGSGAGVPGLVLAELWPDAEAVLLDSSQRRCEFLRRAVRELGLERRVRVVEARAEEAARGTLRGSFPLVVARSFGRPAVVLECGAGFLRPGGYLIVSEPPESDGGSDGQAARWPQRGLGELGQQLVARTGGVALIRQVEQCPDRYPRRTGVPAKRPLF